jgi:ABC-type nickel/cobalt efflux system permease component RcnA
MTRPRSWRPLLTAVAYAAVTAVVLVIAMASMRTSFFQGEEKNALRTGGAALLLLGAGWLIFRALRGARRG